MQPKFWVKYANQPGLLASSEPIVPTMLFDDLGCFGGQGTIMFALKTTDGIVLFDALLACVLALKSDTALCTHRSRRYAE